MTNYPKRPITLIVATTPTIRPSASRLDGPGPSSNCAPQRSLSKDNNSIRLGIGQFNNLPWPRIKSDMTFFARATSRPPQRPEAPNMGHEGQNMVNAVIMGRKTYDSVPLRFRPLKNRINVVVTRDKTGSVEGRVRQEWIEARKREEEKKKAAQVEASSNGKPEVATELDAEDKVQLKKDEPDFLVCDSVASAINDIQQAFSDKSSSLTRNGSRGLGHIYIIGGAEIYSCAIELFKQNQEHHDMNLRVVMTDIRRLDENTDKPMINGFECDTFFPLDATDLNLEVDDILVSDDNDQQRRHPAGSWREVSSEELGTWVGEKIESWKEEGGVVLKARGFEWIDDN